MSSVHWAILITLLATSLLTIFILNLVSGEKQIRFQVEHVFSVHDPEFSRTMASLLGPDLLPGNRITPLQNGDEIFPAMLAAIRGAQHTIVFETYIYWTGEIGREFSDALSARARAGVKVHVILDWFGGKLEAKYLEAMKDAGVEVEFYHPLRWYNLARMNNRTHRKLLVVDGRIGFTGGVGIADHWLGHAQSPNHWRESHFQVEGPVVAQMQAAFADNWIKTRAKVLLGTEYYPELAPAGDTLAQCFNSSWGDGSESVRLMYLLSLASAKEHIRLQNSYFIPDGLAIDTFVAARERGVKVEIIVPGQLTDEKAVRKASRSRWGELLDAGVEIYEFQPTMYHCKVMIVDDAWVSVGSTNFDDRSFRLNAESNLNFYDEKLAKELIGEFEADKLRARLMTRAEFKKRSALGKLVDEMAGMLRRQL